MSNRVYAAVLIGIAALSFGQWWWRRQRARERVEAYLAEHRYRVRELRAPWFTTAHFGFSPMRNDDNAFVFKAVVDDQKLGGTGTVWLRVWMDWTGTIDRDVDVRWARMPDVTRDQVEAPEQRWSTAQLGLLGRIADGETTFRLSGRSAEEGREFDELVEHVLALRHRGLISCGVPTANVRGASEYAAITSIELTDAGRNALQAAKESDPIAP
jgi:hypothetical protein